MTTVEKINRELSRKKMTGAELERKLGFSRSVYSQWNTGKTRPSKKSLARIAEILDVNIDDLLPDDDTEKQGHEVTEDDIKFALFGTDDITDEVYQEVLRYAKYAQEQERFKKFHQSKE